MTRKDLAVIWAISIVVLIAIISRYGVIDEKNEYHFELFIQQYGVDQITANLIEDWVNEASSLTGIDPALLMALIARESAFDINASGGLDEIGLMQLRPLTAGEMGVDIRNPKDNVLGGAMYLNKQLTRFGCVTKALYAYNAGASRVVNDNVPVSSLRYAQDIIVIWEQLKTQISLNIQTESVV